MRNIFLIVLIAVIGFMAACDDHDTLPPYTVATIFSANTGMTHAKDTIKSTGDTIWITAKGGIADTSRTYAISATLKATDTTTATNLISGLYIKSIAVSFDTVGYGTTKLYRWTSTMAFPIPALATKTKIKTTAWFTYGLNLSSQTGNQTGTDSKFTYAK